MKRNFLIISYISFFVLVFTQTQGSDVEKIVDMENPLPYKNILQSIIDQTKSNEELKKIEFSNVTPFNNHRRFIFEQGFQQLKFDFESSCEITVDIPGHKKDSTWLYFFKTPENLIPSWMVVSELYYNGSLHGLKKGTWANIYANRNFCIILISQSNPLNEKRNDLRTLHGAIRLAMAQ